MARVCGACCGLLVFSAMILCGVLAGNPVGTTVLRALAGLFGGFLLGSVSGWIGLFVVKENVAAADGDTATSPQKETESATATDPPPEKGGP